MIRAEPSSFSLNHQMTTVIMAIINIDSSILVPTAPDCGCTHQQGEYKQHLVTNVRINARKYMGQMGDLANESHAVETFRNVKQA